MGKLSREKREAREAGGLAVQTAVLAENPPSATTVGCAEDEAPREVTRRDTFSEGVIAIVNAVNEENDKIETSRFTIGGPVELPKATRRY